MKRYDMEPCDGESERCRAHMSEDSTGEWVKYDDAKELEDRIKAELAEERGKLERNRKAFINHIYISNDEFGRICEGRSNAIDSSLAGFAAIRDAIRLLDNDATSFHNRVRTALKALRKVCPDV